jgi:hypothetical protein
MTVGGLPYRFQAHTWYSEETPFVRPAERTIRRYRVAPKEQENLWLSFYGLVDGPHLPRMVALTRDAKPLPLSPFEEFGRGAVWR